MNAGEGTLTLGQLISKMGELEAATVGELGVLFAFAEKLSGLTTAAIEHSVALEKIRLSTGMNVEELQKWTSIAEQAHVPGDTFTNTIVHMSESLAKLRLHIGGQELVSLANVLHLNLSSFDPSKPMELLKAIQNSPIFKGMKPWEKNAFLDTFGAKDILPFLNLTNSELEKFGEHTSVISRKGRQDFLEIATGLTSISIEAKAFGVEVAEWDAPLFKKTIAYIIEGIEKMHKLFKTDIKETPQYQVDVYDFIKNPSSVTALKMLGSVATKDEKDKNYLFFQILEQLLQVKTIQPNASTIPFNAAAGVLNSPSAAHNFYINAVMQTPDGAFHPVPTNISSVITGKHLKQADQNLKGTGQ